MEVTDECSSMLSNYEVYSLLQDIKTGKKGQKQPNKYMNQLATITYSTLKYLEGTPCKSQSGETFQNFMKALVPFNLTKSEKLQLLNQRPTSAVEIQLIIEESEERLTEEQIEELLEIIVKHLTEEQAEESMQIDVS